MVGAKRIELLTSWSRTKRTTNCAMPRTVLSYYFMTIKANKKRSEFHFSRDLLSSEDSISSISKTWNDITDIV